MILPLIQISLLCQTKKKDSHLTEKVFQCLSSRAVGKQVCQGTPLAQFSMACADTLMACKFLLNATCLD